MDTETSKNTPGDWLDLYQQADGIRPSAVFGNTPLDDSREIHLEANNQAVNRRFIARSIPGLENKEISSGDWPAYRLGVGKALFPAADPKDFETERGFAKHVQKQLTVQNNASHAMREMEKEAFSFMLGKAPKDAPDKNGVPTAQRYDEWLKGALSKLGNLEDFSGKEKAVTAFSEAIGRNSQTYARILPVVESAFYHLARDMGTPQRRTASGPFSDYKELMLKFSPEERRLALGILAGLADENAGADDKGRTKFFQQFGEAFYRGGENLAEGAEMILSKMPEMKYLNNLQKYVPLVDSFMVPVSMGEITREKAQKIIETPYYASEDFVHEANRGFVPSVPRRSLTEQEKSVFLSLLPGSKERMKRMRDEITLAADLQGIAQGKIDPLTGSGWGGGWVSEKILYPFTQSLPYMAVAAVPVVGLAALNTINTGQAQADYLKQGISLENSEKMANVTGAVVTSLDMLKLKVLMGNAPRFAKLLESTTPATWRHMVGNAMKAAGVGYVEEVAAEFGQNATPHVVQTLVSLFDSEVPGAGDKIKEALNPLSDEGTETLLVMIPAAFIGAGVGVARDARVLRHHLTLDALGFNEDAKAAILAADNAHVSEVFALLFNDTAKRNPMTDKARSARRKIAETVGKRDALNGFNEVTGRDGGTGAFLERDDAGRWRVRDVKGNTIVGNLRSFENGFHIADAINAAKEHKAATLREQDADAAKAEERRRAVEEEKGNWEAVATPDAQVPILQLSSLASPHSRFKDTVAWLSQKVTGVFKNINTQWDVNVNEKSVSESLWKNHRLSVEGKNALVAALPQLVKNGVLLEKNVTKGGGLSKRAKRGKPVTSHVLYAPVHVDGKKRIARVIVDEKASGEKNAYVVTAVEIESASKNVRSDEQAKYAVSGDTLIPDAPSSPAHGEQMQDGNEVMTHGELASEVKQHFSKPKKENTSTFRDKAKTKPPGSRGGFITIPPSVLSLADAMRRAGVRSRLEAQRNYSRFRKHWIDAAIAVGDFVKMIEAAGGKKFTFSKNPFYDIQRFRRSVDATVHQMLEKGMVTINGDVMRDAQGNPIAPLKAAFAGLDGAEERHVFTRYLGYMQEASQRYRELAGRVDGDSAYDAAVERMASLEERFPDVNFDARASIVWQWNQAVLDYAGMGGTVGGTVDRGGKVLTSADVRRKKVRVREKAGQISYEIPVPVEVTREERRLRITEETQVFKVPLWDFEFEAPDAGLRVGERLRGSKKPRPIFDPQDSSIEQAAFLVLRAKLMSLLDSQNLTRDPLFLQKKVDPIDKKSADAIIADAKDTVRRMTENGMEDANGNIIGPALNDAFAGLDAANRAWFVKYLHALRVLALDSDGRFANTGMSVEEAQSLSDHYAGTDFQRRAQIVHDWNAGLLDYLASTDRERGDNYFGADIAKIRDADPGSYIPLWRSKEPYQRNVQAPRQGKDAGEVAEPFTQEHSEDTSGTVTEWGWGMETFWEDYFHEVEHSIDITTFTPRTVRNLEIAEFHKDIEGRFESAEQFVTQQTDVARTLVRKAQDNQIVRALIGVAESNWKAAGEDLAPLDLDNVSDEFAKDLEKAGKKALWRSAGVVGKPDAEADSRLLAFMVPPVVGPDGFVYVYSQGFFGIPRWYRVAPALMDAVNSIHKAIPYWSEGAISESWDAFENWRTHTRGVAKFRPGAAMLETLDRLLRGSASLFRSLATAWNPRFGLGTNVIRDFEELTYNTRTGANPVHVWRNWVGAMWSAMVDAVSGGTLHVGEASQYRDLFSRLGLEMAQSLRQDTRPLQVSTDTVLGKTNFRTVAHGVWGYVTTVLQFPETAARVAEMRTVAEKHGWDPSMPMTPDLSVELAMAAKQVTVDFTRAGDYAQRWNTYVPFFNAAIQGKVSAYEAFKRNPAQWLLTRGMVITLTAALNWWRNKDEPLWQQMPTSEKLVYANVLLPGGKGTSGDKQTWLKIPRAFDVDTIFAALPVAILDGIWGAGPQHREGLTQWFKNAFETATVVGSLDGLDDLPNNVADMPGGVRAGYRGGSMVNHDALPPFLKAAWAQGFNEDKFWKRPIVGQGKSEQDLPDQFGPYTSNLAISLGKRLNMSPMRIDHLIQAQGAGTGSFLAGLFGRGDDKGGLAEQDWEPSDALFGMGAAIFRRGGGTPNPNTAASVRNFYQEAGKVFREWDTNGGGAADRLNMIGMANAWKAIGKLTQMYHESPDRAMREAFSKEAIELADNAVADFNSGDMARKVKYYQGQFRRWAAQHAASGGQAAADEPKIRTATKQRPKK